MRIIKLSATEGIRVIFRKKIEPSCSYCKYASLLDEEEAFCLKKGVVSSGGQCKKFKYDPLKRIPPSPSMIRTDFSEEDFKI